MSNTTCLGKSSGKGKQRAESKSSTRVVEARLSFEKPGTDRPEHLHVRSASVPLIDERSQQAVPVPVTGRIRRKPVLSVDSANPAIQQYSEAAQRSTTWSHDVSHSPRSESPSSGSNSPSRSPAFRRSTNTYQESLQLRNETPQIRRLSSPREVRVVSPLTPVSASIHGSLHKTTSLSDQTMDSEDAASRQSSARRAPQPPVTPRRSAENPGPAIRRRSPASSGKDLPDLPQATHPPPVPPKQDAVKAGKQLQPSLMKSSPDQGLILTERELPGYAALRMAYTLAEMVDCAANQLTDMVLPDSRVPEECSPIVEPHLAAKLCDVSLLTTEVQKGFEKHALYKKVQVGKYSILQRGFADVNMAARVLENAMSNNVEELRAMIAEREDM